MFEQKTATVVKKPYLTPSVKIYGSIRTITKAVGTHGKNDGGNVGGQKTSLI